MGGVIGSFAWRVGRLGRGWRGFPPGAAQVKKKPAAGVRERAGYGALTWVFSS